MPIPRTGSGGDPGDLVVLALQIADLGALLLGLGILGCLAQQSGGGQLNSAVQQAQNGDYEAVKAILSKMLENDEAKRLIQRLRNE